MSSSASFCLTNTIDKYTDFGYKYYHNLQQNNARVRMRPRLPLRFDFNDVDIVRIEDPKDLLRYYHRFPQYRNYLQKINPDHVYQLKRTGYSVFNTFLLYLLSVMLIVASVIHMKKIIHALQNDRSLDRRNKMMFRLSFVFSFVVVLFLLCFMGLSVFELWRNTDMFPFLITDHFRYKNLRIYDGNMYRLRSIILAFVLIGVLFALAETLNLYMMKPHKPSILILLLPAVGCLLLLLRLNSSSSMSSSSRP